METIIRAFEADLEILPGEHAILARINTNAVDRLSTVIDPLGGDYSHFNRTKSVLWNHGKDPIRGTVPIGKGWAKARQFEKDIVGKTAFARDKFSDDLFDRYEAGECRGWSIQAAVKEASPPTPAEIRARPELEDCEMIYRKWDLIEYSATPTPGNSDCLTLLIQRSLLTAPEGFVMPPPVTPEPEPPPREPRTERYIDSDGSVWTVFKPNGTPLISFSDPQLAEECLRMMDRTPTLSHQITSLSGELQAVEIARAAELKEYIDLYRWGHV